MEEHIRIEWSGYWDFPGGRYSVGSKVGDYMSGVFPSEYIDIEQTGDASYRIEPGKLGIPNSNDWEFTLINIDYSTDREMFPFEYFANLGRTEEYGGKFNSFGDLFIRATIPRLDHKVIYRGLVDGISYTPHKRRVKVKCVSIIEAIKGLKSPFFVNQDFGSCKVRVKQDTDTVDLFNDFVNYFSPGERAVEAAYDARGQSINVEVLNVLDCENINEEFRRNTENTSWVNTSPDEVHMQLPGEAPHYSVDNMSWRQKVSMWYGEHALLISSLWRQKKLGFRYHRDMIIDDNWNFINIEEDGLFGGTFDDTILFEATRTGDWRTGFVKIGNSTILTQFRLTNQVLITINQVGNHVTDFKSQINMEVAHANNGHITTIINGEEVDILERGRFYKDGDTYNDAVIEGGEELEVSLTDWVRDEVIVDESRTTALCDDNFANYGDYDAGVDLSERRRRFVHGALFDIEYPSAKARNTLGYFDTIEALQHIVRRMISRYTAVQEPNLLVMDEVSEEIGHYAFVSDIVHYGWKNDLSEAIVNAGQQVGAYIFNDEAGNIVFKPRLMAHSDTEELERNAIYIEDEDYEITSGNSYTNNSRYFRYSYTDKVELSNVEGDEEIEVTIDSNGEQVKTEWKPKDVDINNYRTSDLGVPTKNDMILLKKGSNQRFFRKPITGGYKIPEKKFIQTPYQQAKTVALSRPYPNVSFAISLDISHKKKYRDISIGSFVRIDTETGNYDHYLVKEITYNASSIMKDAASVNIKLEEIVYGEPQEIDIPQVDAVMFSDSFTSEYVEPDGWKPDDALMFGDDSSVTKNADVANMNPGADAIMFGEDFVINS